MSFSWHMSHSCLWEVGGRAIPSLSWLRKRGSLVGISPLGPLLLRSPHKDPTLAVSELACYPCYSQLMVYWAKAQSVQRLTVPHLRLFQKVWGGSLWCPLSRSWVPWLLTGWHLLIPDWLILPAAGLLMKKSILQQGGAVPRVTP